MLYFQRWKIITIAVVSVLGVIFALPNFFSKEFVQNLPSWIPHQQINLGLDLQGGSYLLLEIDVGAVIKERVETLEDDIRVALRAAQIGYTGLRGGDESVRVRIRDSAQIDLAVQELQGLATQLQPSLFNVQGGADLEVVDTGNNLLEVRLTEQAVQERQRSAVDQAIEVVRRRIDGLGIREPTVQREGTDRILLQLPGVDNPEEIKGAINRIAKMSFHLVDLSTSVADAERGNIPPGSMLASYAGDAGIQGVKAVLRKRVLVSGDMLIDSQATFNLGQPVVSFRFDSTGAKRFADVTRANVGRPFAIVLDNQIISAPVIQTPILDGVGIITGGFTVQSANELALLLRAGALPAPLQILEERTVGPELGADSIRAGKIASIIAFLVVIVFVGFTYGLFGLAANVALVINMFLIAGVLSLLQATLTLPGIAGIVLTMGMAVDANVLVFERIKEEVRSGKTPMAALENGYRLALSTILDANITTLIAALILFQVGTGPVRGFAVTLAIGIVSSVFTAVTVTRFFLVTWLRRTRPAELPIS